MLRVPVQEIQPGMVLARPISLPNDSRCYLLQRDIEIPMDCIPRLRELGIVEVWVRYRDLEFLEDIIDEGLCDRQRDVYMHVRRNFESMMSGAASELDLHRFEGSIGELFRFLRTSNCGSMLLQKLDAFDNYLMSHSVNVCYLALLLGLKLENYVIQERPHKRMRDAKDLQSLGLGCLLHDVGKMLIAPEVLNKPGRLTPEEMREIKEHPVRGYQMVVSRVPVSAAQVVLNHHQRWDGRGYPERIDSRTGERLPNLSGKGIPIFSRLATMADVYDAATTQRCYSAAKLPVRVLHEMKTICQGYFDPVVERAFYEIIPPFPLGQVVTLSDGAEAAVVDFNPRYPYRPKVQCLTYPTGERVADPALEEIDLAAHRDVHIAVVNGQDVRPWTPEFAGADHTAGQPVLSY